MFCSTIIPTIGRPSLERAVRSVLAQELPDAAFELIVVNDSGRPLPPADWQRSPQIRIIHTAGRERSVARNTGAAIARGRYLHFLDDDDWLLPGGLAALQQLWQRAGDAAWLFGGTQLVDRQGKPLIQLHPAVAGNCFIQMMAGEWLPLQSSLIDSARFFAVGGFAPLIPGIEDVDLARRIALAGEMAGTKALVAAVGMGQENSTTNSGSARRLGQMAREEILGRPGVLARMLGSADDGYWYGRIPRAYFTSAVWNFSHRRVATAVSRLMWGMMGFLFGGKAVFSGAFWRALARPYQSRAFSQGFSEAETAVR